MKRYLLEDILKLIESPYTLQGRRDGPGITDAKTTLEGTADSLVFISPDRSDKKELAGKTKAGIVIADASIQLEEKHLQERCFIIVKNPRYVFAKIVNALFTKGIKFGVHPTATIHPGAKVHPQSWIGPHVYIGESEIGEGTVIAGNTYIYDQVRIGKNVKIQAGTIIGAEGFGYLRGENGEIINFPHIGGVLIEDDVEIGANTCIDRGALGNTHIKKGARIDNLVHIAHNVVIGENAYIIALAMIGGSTRIGDNAWVSPSAVLRDQLKIGDGATVGMGAVVAKDVPANEVWAGSPARPLQEILELQKKLKEL